MRSRSGSSRAGRGRGRGRGVRRRRGAGVVPRGAPRRDARRASPRSRASSRDLAYATIGNPWRPAQRPHPPSCAATCRCRSRVVPHTPRASEPARDMSPSTDRSARGRAGDESRPSETRDLRSLLSRAGRQINRVPLAGSQTLPTPARVGVSVSLRSRPRSKQFVSASPTSPNTPPRFSWARARAARLGNPARLLRDGRLERLLRGRRAPAAPRGAARRPGRLRAPRRCLRADGLGPSSSRDPPSAERRAARPSLVALIVAGCCCAALAVASLPAASSLPARSPPVRGARPDRCGGARARARARPGRRGAHVRG